MSDGMTSNDLIASISNRAHVPVNQSTFTVTDFLDFATEELQLGLVPLIMSVHEDYLLFESDPVPIEPTKFEYRIPSRAIGNKLRDLQYVGNDGCYHEMARIGIGERFGDNATSGLLRRFYVKNNKVVLTRYNNGDLNSSDNSLVFIYYIRPSKLVENDRVGIISNINRTTGEIQFESLPTNFTTQDTYDMYLGTSPYSFLKIDINIISINSNTNSVVVDPDDIPESLSVGDHFALSGECIIPQIPSELHVMLAQMVACRLLESQGDTEGLANANLKLKQMQEAAGIITDNRVDDAPQKIVNRFSLVRLGNIGKRSWRR